MFALYKKFFKEHLKNNNNNNNNNKKLEIK